MTVPKSMTGEIYMERQKKLVQQMQKAGLEAVVVNPGPTLTYLTGLHFHLMERPVVALFSPGQATGLIVPELESAKVQELPYPLKTFSYGDNPATWSKAFHEAMQFLALDGKQVGVEPRALRVLELRFLEDAAPHTHFVSGEAVLASLRVRKVAQEIACMARAVEIAQQALNALIPSIRAGATETQLASELTLQLLRHGSQPETPFAPIVASGPNSANPHAVPTERALQPGDLIVIDFGASFQGYISDITRTFAIGPLDPELERIGPIVEAANTAGRQAAKPGIPAGKIDQAARAVIEQAGYGPYFTHRTGHGIGMEGHEEPYIFGENQLILEPGMAFTVEPGIYLPGRGGVRIEDNLVITENGAQTLSDFPRPVMIID